MSEREDIVRKLTKGQAECIRTAKYLDPVTYGVSGYEVAGRSANSLGLKGLAQSREIRSYTGRSRRGLTLTPLGLQVRAELLR